MQKNGLNNQILFFFQIFFASVPPRGCASPAHHLWFARGHP